LVVNIRVDQEVLMKRLTGRRTCSVCGEIYNVYFGPPKVEGICDKDGGKLLHRADDNEETIRQRLVAYENQTSPLIEYYRQKNLLHDVDGNRDPEPIAQDLCQFLKDA
jgi:adenylate kinase